MKAHGLSFSEKSGRSFSTLIKDFFNPHEAWGRENRDQLLVGIICTIGYLISNGLFKTNLSGWNPFPGSTNGLFITTFICVGLVLFRAVNNLAERKTLAVPWYENYMSMIITLLGLSTLLALQNLNSISPEDATLWINIAILFVVFIIAAGYFVEGSSKEKVIKVWFSLLGYYFSVIVFFYFLETVVPKI